MAPKEETEIEEVHVEVDIRKLPTFSKLNEQVQKIVKSSSLWDLYLADIVQIAIVCSFVPFALGMLKNGGIIQIIIATFILGCFHSAIANRAGHLAIHGSFGAYPKALQTSISIFATEFVGSYSAFMGNYIHVEYHHPYTNIIGLGDSSSWKAPFLGRKSYLFFAPLLLPVITPLVAIQQLVFEVQKIKELFKFLLVLITGLSCHVYIFMTYAGFSSIYTTLAYIFIYRSIFSVSYIHVNIFQHIGLPMYARKSKPPRVYLMSSGVLNLPRNIILDIVFGHSLVNCHVEHHLFPRLSDNMCLKIKPIVSEYLKENNLFYHEDTYWNRLKDFYDRYDELMVKAPPITHFVGIQ